MSLLLNNFKDTSLGTVLDLGCGDGALIEEIIMSGLKADSFTGIDRDENAISEAKSYFFKASVKADLFFYCRELNDWLPRIGSFNTVMAKDLLHHLDEELLNSLITKILFPSNLESKNIQRFIFSELIEPFTQDQLSLWRERSCFLEPSGECFSRAHKNGHEAHELKAYIDRFLSIPHGPTFSLSKIYELFHGKQHQQSLYVCIEEDQVPEPEQIDSMLDELYLYCCHLEGTENFAGVRKRFSRLKEAIQQDGFLLPPRVWISNLVCSC